MSMCISITIHVMNLSMLQSNKHMYLFPSLHPVIETLSSFVIRRIVCRHGKEVTGEVTQSVMTRPWKYWTASKQLILIVHPSTNTSRKLTYASIRRGMRWSEERQLPSTIFPNICKGIRLRESSQSSFDSGSDWRLGEGQRLPMSLWWGWWIWDFGGRKGLCTWISTLIS